MKGRIRIEAIPNTSRTWDVFDDGIWQARVTLDPLLGIIVRSGALDRAQRVGVKLQPGFPFCQSNDKAEAP